MEESKGTLELLRQIEKNSRQQARMGRLQCLFALVAAAACVLVFVALLRILPQVEGLLEQAQVVLGNLEQTTAELANADLEGMVSNVDNLVASGQQSLEKLNTIDFNALNDAIADLSSVVEPLAKFFGAFR